MSAPSGPSAGENRATGQRTTVLRPRELLESRATVPSVPAHTRIVVYEGAGDAWHYTPVRP
jgi:hypothetical protein